jgi:DNA-directed RNA polymerase subunit M/transcription elongation factor TFIIS
LYNNGVFVGRKTYGDRGDATDRNKILKKQIDKLKIENARLRKELNKLLAHFGDTDDEIEEAPIERSTEVRCFKCGSPKTSVLDLSTKESNRRYLICKEENCGYKKKF